MRAAAIACWFGSRRAAPGQALTRAHGFRQTTTDDTRPKFTGSIDCSVRPASRTKALRSSPQFTPVIAVARRPMTRPVAALTPSTPYTPEMIEEDEPASRAADPEHLASHRDRVRNHIDDEGATRRTVHRATP